MKDLHTLDDYRLSSFERAIIGQAGDESNGVFEVVAKGKSFYAIASNREGWEHVQISCKDRCPSWGEICALKDMFFAQEDKDVQNHLEQGNFVNPSFFWLHLWRPIGVELPTPPRDFV